MIFKIVLSCKHPVAITKQVGFVASWNEIGKLPLPTYYDMRVIYSTLYPVRVLSGFLTEIPPSFGLYNLNQNKYSSEYMIQNMRIYKQQSEHLSISAVANLAFKTTKKKKAKNYKT